MRVLVWQWGRFGAGPRFAVELARAFGAAADVGALLSLSAGAELVASAGAPHCDLPVQTYTGITGLLGRVFRAPGMVARLAAWVSMQRIDVAVCAMPGPLDLVMAAALRRAGVPYAVVVHDADSHPGDAFPFQYTLQRALLRGSAGVFALSSHVAGRLREQGMGTRRLMLAALPPFAFGAPPPPPRTHGGPLRLLSFGRLLPYKGLDLLADSLVQLGPRPDLEVRVVGRGPETPVLDVLRRLPGVQVENRWVPEDEVGALLAWADGLVLSHREASQSGVAASAIAARRWLVATRVGGLEEQLRAEPMALLCDPTAESIAGAIRRLLEMDGPPASDYDPHAAWRSVADGMVAGLRGMVRPGRA